MTENRGTAPLSMLALALYQRIDEEALTQYELKVWCRTSEFSQISDMEIDEAILTLLGRTPEHKVPYVLLTPQGRLERNQKESITPQKRIGSTKYAMSLDAE